MAYSVKALTTALSEAKRFASYASDSLRLLANRRLIISQHEDCLFGFTLPEYDKIEDILLSDAFIEGEGKQIAREHFQRLAAANGGPVCLLDANEDNLYNESTRGPRCVYLAGGIAAYGVSNGGDILAVAFCTGMLAFYSIVTEDSVAYLTKKAGLKTNSKNVTQVCFDTTDAYTACGTVDGAVAVYHECTLMKNFHHQKGSISVMRFHPSGLRLLAGSQYGDITIYCLKAAAPIATFQGHLSHVNDIAFLIADDESQEGFVSCSRDSNICFWSLEMKEKEVEKAVADGHVIVKKPFKRLVQFESVVAISIVTTPLRNKASGPWALFLATESGILGYIDPLSETMLMERKVAYGQGDELKCVIFSKSTEEIIVLGSNGTLCFYSIDLNLRHQFLTNIDGAFQFQLYKGIESHKVEEIINMEDEEDVDMDEQENEDEKETRGPKDNQAHEQEDHANESNEKMEVEEPLQLSNSATGKEQKETDVANTSRDDWTYSVQWLKRQVNKGIPLVFILCGDDAVRIMALDGMGSYVALGLGNESCRHEDTVLSTAYSPDLNIVASGGKDERIMLWDLRTLSALATVTLDGLNVACIALQSGVNPETVQLRMVATGDNVLKSFDIPISWDRNQDTGFNYDEVKDLKPASVTMATATVVRHKKPINAVAFSPNNKMVATGGSDKIVVIYAAYNLIVTGECIGHRRSVVCVAFTRVNKTVVSGSVDMTIKIWNLNDFTCIKTLQGHTKAVMKVCVITNDLQLLSVGMDGLLKVWNIRTSDCIFTADNHSDKVWSAEICGSNVLTISGNGVMIWWDDISADVEAKRLLEEREEEMRRTQVESLAADGKYSEALSLAMELRKPNIASKILERRCAMQVFRIEKQQSVEYDIFSAWVAHVLRLPDRKKMLTIALDFVQLWNARSSTSWMANCLLSELIKQLNPGELFIVEGMAQRIESFLSHQSSHITRYINLSEKSHLLDIIVGFKASEPKKEPSFSHDVLYN